MSRTGIPINKVIEALKQAHGIPADAAKILNLTPRAVRKRIASSAKLRKVCTEEKAKMIDVCESELFKKIQAGNLNAIKYYLSRMDRRYSAKVNIEGSGLQAGAQVVIVIPHNNRDDYPVDGQGQRTIESHPTESRPPDDGVQE